MDVSMYGAEVSHALLAELGGAEAGGGSMDFGGVADVAFAVALLELESLDGVICDRLRDLHHGNDLRKAYGDRISRLQGHLTAMPDGDDKAWIPAEDSPGIDLAWDPAAAGGDGGIVRTTVDGAPMDPAGLDEGGAVEVSREDLEREITRLQGQQDQLGADTEVGMLGLNRLLGRRNQVLQLTSNVMSSAHQTAMGIIANLKV